MADLFAQYRSLKFELDKAIGNVISKSQFIRGEQSVSKRNLLNYLECQIAFLVQMAQTLFS